MLDLGLLGCSDGGGVLPLGLEEAEEITKGQLARGVLKASKVEDDIGLHRSEEREAGLLGGSVQEVGLGDGTVLASGDGGTDDTLDHVHLADDVVEGHDVGEGNLVAGINIAESRQVLEDVVGELVTGDIDHDLLELVGGNVAAGLGIIVFECLAKAFSLESLEELSELLVGHLVSSGLFSGVELEPLALKVEGNGVLSNVGREDLLELFPSDLTRSSGIEKSEGDLVVGIGTGEEVLEDGANIASDSDNEQQPVRTSLELLNCFLFAPVHINIHPTPLTRFFLCSIIKVKAG